MAWTTPRDWTTSEFVTAAIMNAHVRDNLNALRAETTKAVVQLEPFSIADNEALSTGDGKAYLPIPSKINGWYLYAVHAELAPDGAPTTGGNGAVEIAIYNVTDSVDMLSTNLTVDQDETGSDTAATAAVINSSNNQVATYDLLRLDFDAVEDAEGCIVTLTFSEVQIT